MSDWVLESRRTWVFCALASILWVVGTVSGLSSARTGDVLDIVCGLSFLVLLAMAVGMMVFTAIQCRNSWRMRSGWLLVGLALAVSFVSTATMVADGWRTLSSHFNGVALGLNLGFLAAGVGLTLAASSLPYTSESRRPAIRALGLSLLMFVMLVAAFIGPGPAMPFSIGPRDGVAFGRLLIDTLLLMLPTAYATFAQLKLPNGHRARAWMWAFAAALMLAMGDAVAPLVDTGHGQIYPTLLWTLGVVLLASAAAMTADFEIDDHTAKSQRA